ncbi:hypothetical protein AVEN_54734-1 [Araneus ventricosus]|uniref:Uncharacterized protein n=1 Tax=Araneus ventricosus TaxID=182803 RepID=A0A4Y2FB05_ARAVE|nr:hypothetical protein AVEN_54734-1 [Araneus ventricosus]
MMLLVKLILITTYLLHQPSRLTSTYDIGFTIQTFRMAPLTKSFVFVGSDRQRLLRTTEMFKLVTRVNPNYKVSYRVAPFHGVNVDYPTTYPHMEDFRLGSRPFEIVPMGMADYLLDSLRRLTSPRKGHAVARAGLFYCSNPSRSV